MLHTRLRDNERKKLSAIPPIIRTVIEEAITVAPCLMF